MSSRRLRGLVGGERGWGQGADISWKRMLDRSRALEASERSIAVSMLGWRLDGSSQELVLLGCERVTGGNERSKGMN